MRQRTKRWKRFQLEDGSMQTVDALGSVVAAAAAAAGALYVFVLAGL